MIYNRGFASKQFTSIRYGSSEVRNQRCIPKRSYFTDEISTNTSVPISVYPKDGVGTCVDISKYFDFSLFNSFCDRNSDLNAIIPVYSSADNFRRRWAVRNTVGKNCVNFKCAVFFIVGVSKNESVNTGVRAEYKLEKDMLMISKMDTYRDLNNKAIAMLDWLVQFCPQPKYVIHIIDDTYPNIRYFLDHMNSIKETKYLLGVKAFRAPVMRGASNKWYTSTAEYPGKTYPTYAIGTAYAFLNNRSQLLRDTAYEAGYLWIEDVWLTGFVRTKAGFDIVPVKKRMIEVQSTKDRKLWDKHSCVHKVSVDGFYDIYNATL